MRVLFVCHRFPFPPNDGARIRSYHTIKHLHDAGHEVVVASLVRSREEAKAGEGMAAHCARYLMERVIDPLQTVKMVARLPVRTPSSMGYFYSQRLAERIAYELETTTYDLIVVHCSSVAQYVEDVAGIPKILDFADMDSQKWISYGPMKRFPVSLGYYVEGFKMQLAEIELAKKFDVSTCTTAAEIATLDGFGTGARTDWFPNGVDFGRFGLSDAPYDPDTICFVGRMDYYPNQECMFDFVANTWPLLRARRPEIKLTIVGAEPSREVRALANHPGVTVTGSVPEVQPYLRRAACTVAPLNIARGTQNKILESLAMGIPVVCSELASGGVDAVAGKHLLAGRTPQEYASAILRLVENPGERRRFSEAGRARMLSHHSWEVSMKRFDRIVADAVEAVRRRHQGAA